MVRTTSAPTRRQRGFTLMELIVVIVVLGILSAIGSSMIVDTFRATRMVNASQSSADEARYAVERLAREIREVTHVVSGASGSYSISAMTPRNMVFARSVAGGTTTVTVTINKADGETNLTLGYSPPGTSSVLARQVTGVNDFNLDYLTLTPSGTTPATTLPAQVRFVVITLKVTDATSGKAITERVRVALRNE